MTAIITDSSSNITREEAASLGVTVMPLTIIFGAEEFKDGVDLDCGAFYKKLVSAKEFPHTAQLTYGQIEEAIKTALQSADEAVILPISSALSGSHQRCVEVAEKYKNVRVFNTLCTTVMLKMLVAEAAANREKTADEICALLGEYRPKLRLFAALDTLEYLCKGGRISGAAARIGSILRIKPVVTVNSKGEVELLSKQFGLTKCLDYIAAAVKKDEIDFSRPVVFIYTMDDANCRLLAAKTGLNCASPENICPVIGTHIGPRAAGIVYAKK